MIVLTFVFTLVLSMAGNVIATWGDPVAMGIGFVVPVCLILAEVCLRRAPTTLARVFAAVIVVSGIVYSAQHLASLGHGWTAILIPVIIDALMLLSGGILMATRHAPEPAGVQASRMSVQVQAERVQGVQLPVQPEPEHVQPVQAAVQPPVQVVQIEAERSELKLNVHERRAADLFSLFGRDLNTWPSQREVAAQMSWSVATTNQAFKAARAIA